MKNIKYTFVVVSVVFGSIIFISFFGWALYNWLAPKYVNTDYEVFKNSQSYRQGMISDLQNLRLEYVNPLSTDAQKQAIRDTIIQRFGSFDPKFLPEDLKGFYYTMMQRR